MKKIYIDKETLIDLYINKKQTAKTIGKILNCSKYPILQFLKKYKIKTRNKSYCQKGIQSGEKNPAYKGGKSKCVDCGKITSSYKTKRCMACSAKFQKGRPRPKQSFKIRGKNNPNWKGGFPKCIDCGKKLSSHKAIRCKKCYNNIMNGKNHPSWIDGRSFLPYPYIFNTNLKQQIRKRDNFTCQNCGITEEEHLIVQGTNLHIHHINYNKQDCKEENLITVCNWCNIRANYNRDYWFVYYLYIIENIIYKEKLKWQHN